MYGNRSVCVVLACFILGACMSRQRIVPRSLSQLNSVEEFHSSATAWGPRGIATLEGRSTSAHRLETLDGRLILVDGDSPVYIVTRDGEEHVFYQPIQARFEEDGTLVLMSRQRRETRFNGEDIQSIEVETDED